MNSNTLNQHQNLHTVLCCCHALPSTDEIDHPLSYGNVCSQENTPYVKQGFAEICNNIKTTEIFEHLFAFGTNCMPVLFNLIKNSKALFKVVKLFNVSVLATSIISKNVHHSILFT